MTRCARRGVPARALAALLTTGLAAVLTTGLVVPGPAQAARGGPGPKPGARAYHPPARPQVLSMEAMPAARAAGLLNREAGSFYAWEIHAHDAQGRRVVHGFIKYPSRTELVHTGHFVDGDRIGAEIPGAQHEALHAKRARRLVKTLREVSVRGAVVNAGTDGQTRLKSEVSALIRPENAWFHLRVAGWERTSGQVLPVTYIILRKKNRPEVSVIKTGAGVQHEESRYTDLADVRRLVDGLAGNTVYLTEQEDRRSGRTGPRRAFSGPPSGYVPGRHRPNATGVDPGAGLGPDQAAALITGEARHLYSYQFTGRHPSHGEVVYDFTKRPGQVRVDVSLRTTEDRPLPEEPDSVTVERARELVRSLGQVKAWGGAVHTHGHGSWVGLAPFARQLADDLPASSYHLEVSGWRDGHPVQFNLAKDPWRETVDVRLYAGATSRTFERQEPARLRALLGSLDHGLGYLVDVGNPRRDTPGADTLATQDAPLL